MSEPVSALRNIRATGGIAQIAGIGPLGMITLRGDLSAGWMRKAAIAATSASLPDQGRCEMQEDGGLAWMSPDELLLICPYAEVPERLEKLNKGLKDRHALAVNVSDARAIFDVSGPAAREVVAKLAPVDLSPGEFAPGQFRRTRLAQVPAALWMPDAERIRLVVFRSVARYVYDLLEVAAQPGSEVGYF